MYICFYPFSQKLESGEEPFFVDYENSLEILKRQINDNILNKYPVNVAELWDLGGEFVGKIKNNTKCVTSASDYTLGSIKESHSAMSSTVPKINVDREDLKSQDSDCQPCVETSQAHHS